MREKKKKKWPRIVLISVAATAASLVALFYLICYAAPLIYAPFHPLKVVQNRHDIELDGKKYGLYWGELHGHSGLSPDAFVSTPEQYYRYGKEVAKLDFAALTDHDAPWGLAAVPSRWKQSVDATRRWHEDGVYVAFIAYEWTSGSGLDCMFHTLKRRDRWEYQKDPMHFGHRNVYYPGDEAPAEVCSVDSPDCDTPEKLWEHLEEYGAISIPHHPLGGPIYPFNWDRFNPKYEPVVEIYSWHGNSECDGCPYEIYNAYKNGKHSARTPLDAGHHFGFIASSDSHDGYAGNLTRPPRLIKFLQMFYKGKATPGPGIAAVYAEELSREGIFEALRAKRTYAATGARIVMDVRANETTFMGGRLDSRGAPVSVSIYARGVAPLEKIEVIKNGETAAVFEGDGGPEFKQTHIDALRERDEDYIYIRVTQTDGQMAWSSPIWIK
ncbi:MAG TPA: CehA/McbA family metallohydrolase [bacterium]|nr:CehA/McbA family metallohydrolase [bacterium]